MKMTIKAQGLKAVAKKLEKNSKVATKVLTATANDMRRRVPGKVADEVRTVYNIKKSEVTPSGKSAKPKRKAGTISVKGATVADVTITYTGRLLTPTHFGMLPKKPQPRSNGKRRRKPVTAEIKKGKRKSLGSSVFLGDNGAGSYIPFRRTTAKRYPIEALRTLSLPQMVDNDTVSQRIEKDVNDLLETRLEHNMKRFMK